MVTAAMRGRAEVELDLDDVFRGFDEVGTEDNDLKCGVGREELKSPRWLGSEGDRKLCYTVSVMLSPGHVSQHDRLSSYNCGSAR